MKDYLNEKLSNDERIISLISEYGFIDGSHHKQWLLDQIVRVAMGCPLKTEQWKDSEGKMHDYKTIGENENYNEWASGDEEYSAWDTGIAP